jgi:putative FmdB family regulatory protein
MRYDYKCIACGHEAEEVHPMNQDALTLCPICCIDGAYHKVIYATPVMFVGEGWETNSKSGRYHPKGGT